MSQQINLYNPAFGKRRVQLSLTTMVQALGLILLGAILLAAYLPAHVSDLSRQSASVTAQRNALQVQLEKISKDSAPPQKNQMLETSIDAATAELRSMQQVLATLQLNHAGNTQAYSHYLQAFSQSIIDGVWLTGLSINGAEHEIALQGRALKPELVADYITHLKQMPILKGATFSTLKITLAAPAATTAGGAGSIDGGLGYVEFDLRSAGIAAQATATTLPLPAPAAQPARNAGARVQ